MAPFFVYFDMSTTMIDYIGVFFIWLIPLSPLISFLMVWKRKNLDLRQKISLGILISFVIIAFSYVLGMGIIFREGMGPG